MSRFYDALKHASRSLRSGNPNSEEEDWAAIDIPAPPAPATPRNSEIDEIAEVIAGPAAAVPAAPAADPWVLAPEPDVHRRRTPRNGAFGSSAHAVLDQTARVIPNTADPVIVEHYRRLRTKLVQQHALKPFRSVIVTSASPQEGKTVTTLNLAFSFAMLPSFKVAVVDGDLRRGSLGKWLGVVAQPGLSDLIEGSATLNDVVYSCEELPIHFVVRGNSNKPAAELLHSPELGNHLRSLTEQFDIVLIDSPPVNLITDAHLLASHCDAVLLVARAFSTTRKQLEKAVEDLQPFRIVGTVLNGGTRAHSYHRYGGYY